MTDYAHTQEKLIALLEPVAVQNGFELVDAEERTEHGKRILRLFVDKDQGVNVDDCAFISAYFEDVLDVSEVLTGAYVLEVSSPGLNRPLRTLPHFQKAVGKKIQVVTKEKLDGRKNYKGLLQSVGLNDVTIAIDGQDFVLPIEKIQKANVVY